MRVYQVDAFTRERFRGNPAGVVPDARGLTADQMQAIARELNNPETAFVVDRDPGGRWVRVRFFSPAVEVGLCGHASLATHHVLASEHGLPPGPVQQHSPGGRWTVELERRLESVRVWLVQEPVRVYDPLTSEARGALLDALRLEEAALDDRFPVRAVDTGHAKLLVGVGSSDVLDGMAPDMTALTAFQRRSGWEGIQVFTVDTREDDVDVASRMFAPVLGISEDPVTGSGQGPIGVVLALAGLLPREGESGSGRTLVAVQGRAMSRPGTAWVKVEESDGRPIRVRVGGEAVTVFRADVAL